MLKQYIKPLADWEHQIATAEGDLTGVETCVFEFERAGEYDFVVVDNQQVPTEAEVLRLTALLITKCNATRFELDASRSHAAYGRANEARPRNAALLARIKG